MSSGDIKLISILVTDIWYSTLRGQITLSGYTEGQWWSIPGQPLMNSPFDKAILHCHRHCYRSCSPIDRTAQVSINDDNAVFIHVIFSKANSKKSPNSKGGMRMPDKAFRWNKLELICQVIHQRDMAKKKKSTPQPYLVKRSYRLTRIWCLPNLTAEETQSFRCMFLYPFPSRHDRPFPIRYPQI